MVSLGGVRSSAQAGPASGLPDGAYCGGVVTTQPPSTDLYVISGPEPELKTIWSQGNFVYINRGASQGVKIGDEFLVSRPETDPLDVPVVHRPNDFDESNGHILRGFGANSSDHRTI